MAKRAFDHCAGDYARYRPTYPREVIELVERSAPPGPIADVGAGTGIFSVALAATGRRVWAIDPSAVMLQQIRDTADAATLKRLVAPAERLPLGAGTMAAVTCAQSFHWFNPPLALAEFARVLVPRGLLLLVWNNRDVADPFVSAFEQLVTRYNPAYCCEYRQQDWVSKIESAGCFGRVEAFAVRSAWRLAPDEFLGFTRSASYIRNVLSAEDRTAFEAEVRRLVERYTQGGVCTVPLNTQGWWCRRL